MAYQLLPAVVKHSLSKPLRFLDILVELTFSASCACFTFACMLHPAAHDISVNAMQDLRKGHVRKFWEWGRCAYRCIAFSYGAFSVYENPWLVRAVVTALWTAGKVMLGMLL